MQSTTHVAKPPQWQWKGWRWRWLAAAAAAAAAEAAVAVAVAVAAAGVVRSVLSKIRIGIFLLFLSPCIDTVAVASSGSPNKPKTQQNP